ncbi:MAG TPA: hypothetical protein VLA48_00645 [Nitrososphaeraceae archaeon]|nr:hypothetical protein [Nitrososphaeraceae archaeon]
MSLSSSSFIIEVQAQTAESEYGYDDNNYNSEYPQEYGYDKKYYTPKDPPADIIVPIDFDTIQEAIEEANEGDVIKVFYNSCIFSNYFA